MQHIHMLQTVLNSRIKHSTYYLNPFSVSFAHLNLNYLHLLSYLDNMVHTFRLQNWYCAEESKVKAFNIIIPIGTCL